VAKAANPACAAIESAAGNGRNGKALCERRGQAPRGGAGFRACQVYGWQARKPAPRLGEVKPRRLAIVHTGGAKLPRGGAGFRACQVLRVAGSKACPHDSGGQSPAAWLLPHGGAKPRVVGQAFEPARFAGGRLRKPAPRLGKVKPRRLAIATRRGQAPRGGQAFEPAQVCGGRPENLPHDSGRSSPAARKTAIALSPP